MGDGNAVLNILGRPKDEFGLYAEAFHGAARSLVESFSGRPGYSDVDACPIVFLYRHAAELYLKGILICGASILGFRGKPTVDVARLLGEHSLRKVLPDVRRVFEAVDWGWSWEEEPTPRQLEELLGELDEVDSGSHAFRYPTDRRGEGSVTEHFSFHVEDFARRMDLVLRMLESAESGLQHILEGEYEAASYAADYAGDYDPHDDYADDPW